MKRIAYNEGRLYYITIQETWITVVQERVPPFCQKSSKLVNSKCFLLSQVFALEKSPQKFPFVMG